MSILKLKNYNKLFSDTFAEKTSISIEFFWSKSDGSSKVTFFDSRKYYPIVYYGQTNTINYVQC